MYTKPQQIYCNIFGQFEQPSYTGDDNPAVLEELETWTNQKAITISIHFDFSEGGEFGGEVIIKPDILYRDDGEWKGLKDVNEDCFPICSYCFR